MQTITDHLGQPIAARSARPAISVVMPAFNEAESLTGVLDELRSTLAARTERWEVIVVDDGSRDDTAAVATRCARVPGIRVVRLSRNFGKEAALTAGIDRARGEVVVLMDADGQHPVHLLDAMLEAWRDGADMVCAVRASRADEAFGKRVGTHLFYRLVNAGSPVPIPEDAGDFRLLDRRVVDALKALPERNRFMKGLYAWVGFETRTLAYTPQRRRAGRSSFSLRRLGRLALTGITAFSNFPLRLWSGVGTVIALGALLYGVWVIIEHFVDGHPVPGWATLVAGLMFFSGVQLLSIGILGEYIGRIFDEVKQRPVYLVASEQGESLIDAQAVRGVVPFAAPSRVA
jgi:glycosyltransferase involved in cell wall biosynthesis